METNCGRAKYSSMATSGMPELAEMALFSETYCLLALPMFWNFTVMFGYFFMKSLACFSAEVPQPHQVMVTGAFSSTASDEPEPHAANETDVTAASAAARTFVNFLIMSPSTVHPGRTSMPAPRISILLDIKFYR